MADETTKPIMPWTLINDAYFKAYSPIPLNYNLDEIRPFYSIAEQLWVIDVLGIPLYNELLQQVNDNDVTELNSTLLLKVFPYEAIAITYESLHFVAYHLSETGITRGKSENSDSVTTKDVNFIHERLRDQLELLKKYLIKFLDDNASLYPLYKPAGETCACSCEKGDEWLWDYYFGSGTNGINRYSIERMRARCMAEKFKPNPNLLLYSIPQTPIDIY